MYQLIYKIKKHMSNYIRITTHARIQRGAGDPDIPPLTEKSQHKEFLSNTGQDPLKNHKAAKPDSISGRHLHAIETPFKWRFAGGPMMARL